MLRPEKWLRSQGKYTQLETECTGVLAQLRRKELATESGVLSVRLVLRTRETRDDVHFWELTATGSADVQGYAEVPMTRSEDGLHWEHEIKLKPSDDFPYIALASPDGDMRNKPAIAMAQFWLSRQHRMLCRRLN